MQGEYIVNRLLPDFVADACSKLGYECRRMSDNWVIRVEGNGKRRWVIGYTFDLNGAAAAGVANDKVAASLALSYEKVPVVMHYLERSFIGQPVQLSNLVDIGEESPVVIKPLSGSGGRGVQLLPSRAAALDIIQESQYPEWALSPYYQVVSEKRAIMLDGRALCSYDKTEPDEQDGLKMFNLGRGAVAVNSDLTPEERDIAERALQASGLRVASVDIATLSDGSLIIMEVNNGITMEHYARQSDEYREIAANTYFEIVKAMMQ